MQESNSLFRSSNRSICPKLFGGLKSCSAHSSISVYKGDGEDCLAVLVLRHNPSSSCVNTKLFDRFPVCCTGDCILDVMVGDNLSIFIESIPINEHSFDSQLLFLFELEPDELELELFEPVVFSRFLFIER